MPPFNLDAAAQKVRLAEVAWNSRDPQSVSRAHTIDTHWRNRAEFPVGREAVIEFRVAIGDRVFLHGVQRRAYTFWCCLPVSRMSTRE